MMPETVRNEIIARIYPDKIFQGKELEKYALSHFTRCSNPKCEIIFDRSEDEYPGDTFYLRPELVEPFQKFGLQTTPCILHGDYLNENAFPEEKRMIIAANRRNERRYFFTEGQRFSNFEKWEPENITCANIIAQPNVAQITTQFSEWQFLGEMDKSAVAGNPLDSIVIGLLYWECEQDKNKRFIRSQIIYEELIRVMEQNDWKFPAQPIGKRGYIALAVENEERVYDVAKIFGGKIKHCSLNPQRRITSKKSPTKTLEESIGIIESEPRAVEYQQIQKAA